MASEYECADRYWRTAAFIYSLIWHLLIGAGSDYMFYETTATIITLVFLGNYMEDASVQSTQRALKKLAKSQKVMANMIAYDDQHQEADISGGKYAIESG